MAMTSHLHRDFKDVGKKAQRVYEVIKGGGIAIIPVYAGYGIFGASDHALDKIYEAKRRAPHKLYTLVGNHGLHRQVHVIEPITAAFVNRVTEDLDFALGVVALIRPDHRLVQNISAYAMARSSKRGKVNMLLNSGALMERLAEQAIEDELPIFGTSANLSGFGLKGRVQDIEAPVLAVADVVVDEGLLPGYSSTIVDLTQRTTVRFGHRYEDIRKIATEEFGIDLALEASPA